MLWQKSHRRRSAIGYQPPTNRESVPRDFFLRGGRMKLDRSRLPALTPDLLHSGRPAGPLRFSLSDTPERERPAMYREFFGRTVMGVEVEPLQNATFEVDLAVQALPGLN